MLRSAILAAKMLKRGIVRKLTRRKFLHLAAGTAALPAVSQIATAQTYVRIV